MWADLSFEETLTMEYRKSEQLANRHSAPRAIFVGACFGTSLVVAGYFLNVPSSLVSGFGFSLWLILDIAGSVLVSFVAFSVFKRLQAKLELAYKVRALSPEDLRIFRQQIEYGIPLRPLTIENTQRPDVSGIDAIFLYLKSPLGQLAAHALFQQSRSGRERYFMDLMSFGQTK